MQNGVVKQGDANYDRAQLARRGGIWGQTYKSPTGSLLAPEGDTTFLG